MLVRQLEYCYTLEHGCMVVGTTGTSTSTSTRWPW